MCERTGAGPLGRRPWRRAAAPCGSRRTNGPTGDDGEGRAAGDAVAIGAVTLMLASGRGRWPVPRVGLNSGFSPGRPIVRVSKRGGVKFPAHRDLCLRRMLAGPLMIRPALLWATHKSVPSRKKRPEAGKFKTLAVRSRDAEPSASDRTTPSAHQQGSLLGGYRTCAASCW